MRVRAVLGTRVRRRALSRIGAAPRTVEFATLTRAGNTTVFTIFSTAQIEALLSACKEEEKSKKDKDRPAEPAAASGADAPA